MNVFSDFSLLHHNTFGIDAVASRFVEVESADDYGSLFSMPELRSSPFFILGGGANVVFADHYEGTVIHPVNRGVRLVDRHDGHCFVEAQSGESWDHFVRTCIANGWYGLENMVSIPGSVGASAVQNVGAYGSEAKDVIERVHVFSLSDGSQRWVEASECCFAYRHSIFKDEWKDRYIIDRILFRLHDSFSPKVSYKALSDALEERAIANPSASDVADVVTAIRASKLPDPQVVGSAGSFFKNPVVDASLYNAIRLSYPDVVAHATPDGGYKISAGWMIDRCGWKGRTVGRVGVYEKQALVLVNRGGCNGQEVRLLASDIVADIKSHFGVELQCEAIFVN